MKIIGVIPARYQSSRFPGKPLADICGKPMIWWVYQHVSKVKELSGIYVATDDERIKTVCEEYGMNVVMTSKSHNTPTSRLYEVATLIDGDKYVFIGGDEPLLDSMSITKVVLIAREKDSYAVNAMTKIKTAPEVIDFTNIKIVVNSNNQLLYASRSPLPYPKGSLNFDYMKFVGVGVFSRNALSYYNNRTKSTLEIIEECDLIRFIEGGKKVDMVEVTCDNISVDTPKDLEKVREIITGKLERI